MFEQLAPDTTISLENEPPLVLVVEDDRTTRMLLRRAMEKEGYRVAEATDGEQALADYNHLQPDIVLLDAVMPVMDGFTCCRHLQALPGGDRTPLLIITSLDDPESVDRAFEVGASDYVTKPIHWAVLRQRVRRLIQQSHLYKQLEAANQKLRRLASLDGLTQVANRRLFDERFEKEWLRLAREQASLSLIMCDVDFFKAYNDTYGHQAGDECLQQVARAITESVRRPADLVARYGGEEFAVILPNTESAGAVLVAESIRKRVEALAIVHATSTASKYITVSLGVASVIPVPSSLSATLILAADKALYQAKASGRDAVVLMQ